MEKSVRLKVRFQIWVVSIGVLLLLVKFGAFLYTNSNAILTDALESIINVVAGGLALYSLILAGKPRDKNHPYGHGKIEFISASVEGTLILLAGSAMIIKSVYNLIYPLALGDLSYGIVLVSFSGVINYIMGYMAERKGVQHHSMTLIAGGRHLKSDAYSTVGLLVGLGLIWLTGEAWLDNVVAIIFGTIIGITGYNVLKQSIGGIMDEADYDLVDELVHILHNNRRKNWVDLHNLRVIRFGDKIHVDCHVTVPYYFSVKEGHDEISLVDALINKNVENNVEFFIHTDPCEPDFSCKVCIKDDCEVRQHPLQQKIEWDLENVMLNAKHQAGEE